MTLLWESIVSPLYIQTHRPLCGQADLHIFCVALNFGPIAPIGGMGGWGGGAVKLMLCVCFLTLPYYFISPSL